VDINALMTLVPRVARKKRKKRKKEPYYSPFPVGFPSQMTTPRGYQAGSGDVGGSQMGPGKGESVTKVRPSRARVMHELKRSMGLMEFSSHSWGTSSGANVNPSWGGYSVPQLGQVKMRKGGPTIGGPGFQYNVDGEEDRKGGRYDFQKSPGLGFRTEAAWRVWLAALEVMERDPTGTKVQILVKALGRAGVFRGQIDPSELRLVEMGIEWYLTDTGALAAKRGGGMAPYSGGPTDSGGSLAGAGAP